MSWWPRTRSSCARASPSCSTPKPTSRSSRSATTPSAARRGRRHQARRRAHRHPHATDGHRRGHPGRDTAPRDAPRPSASSCSRSTPSPPTPSRCSTAAREGRAYLLKERISDAATSWSAAIHEVAGGGSVVDPKVVEVLVDGPQPRRRSPARAAHAPRDRGPRPRSPRARTTPRSRRRSCLSERAVEKHINSLFSKLGLTEEPRRPPPGQGRPALPGRDREGGPRGASTTHRDGGAHPGPSPAAATRTMTERAVPRRQSDRRVRRPCRC